MPEPSCGSDCPSRSDCEHVQSSLAICVKPLYLCAALQVLRNSCPMTWSDPSPSSDLLQYTRGSVPSSGTLSSLLTLSSKIPPCRPIQHPTLSPSWKKLAGGWRRRKKGLENSPLNKGMAGGAVRAREGENCSEGGELREKSSPPQFQSPALTGGGVCRGQRNLPQSL